MPLMSSTRVLSGGSALLKLGREVVSSLRDGSPNSIELLERYSSSFAAWEESWRGADSKELLESAKGREIGRRVAAQHAQILRLGEEMRQEMGESLRALRVKGRGLKAYIDDLPPRVSTIKTRKG